MVWRIAVEDEVVLSAIHQLCVLGRDIGIDIQRVMDRVQSFLVSSDSNIHHLRCLIDDVLVTATPVEDNITSFFSTLLVGGLRNGQRSQHGHFSIQLLYVDVQQG